MVKIRLRRSGSKHRPFYRVVVAKSTAGRDGSFIEIIGTYNPVLKPKLINIKEDRAIHWLMSGAQPSETAAIIMHRAGILDKYFEQRPNAKNQYKFLDKRTAAMSVKSVMSAPPVEKAPKAEAPVPEPDETVIVQTQSEPSVEVEPEIVESAAEVSQEADATVEAEVAATEDVSAQEPAAEVISAEEVKE